MERKKYKKNKIKIAFFIVLLAYCFIGPSLFAEPVSVKYYLNYLIEKMIKEAEFMDGSRYSGQNFQYGGMDFEFSDGEIKHANEIRQERVEDVVSETIGEIFLQTRTGKKIDRLEKKFRNLFRIEYFKYTDGTEFELHMLGEKNEIKKDGPPKIIGVWVNTHVFSDSFDPMDSELELNSVYHGIRASAGYKPGKNELTFKFTNELSNQFMNAPIRLEFESSGSKTLGMIKFEINF